MKPKTSFWAFLKPLSMHSFAPSAASAKASRPPPNHAAVKVCRKLTWHSTYSRKPAPRCMSRSSSNVSRPNSPSPSIAKAWFLPSPRKSPAATASCARKRIPSPLSRSHDEPALGVPHHYRRLARRLPTKAHLCPWRAASIGLAGLPWTALPYPYHLDERRTAAQLERGVFPPLTLSLGTAEVVPAHLESCVGVLPATVGRRGHRRYQVAQDRTLH